MFVKIKFLLFKKIKIIPIINKILFYYLHKKTNKSIVNRTFKKYIYNNKVFQLYFIKCTNFIVIYWFMKNKKILCIMRVNKFHFKTMSIKYLNYK